MSAQEDYPLNCIDTVPDGFSGWFAISNPRVCRDFCYWNATSAKFGAENTADPHQATVIRLADGNASYWTCVLDAADDDFPASRAAGRRWAESRPGRDAMRDGATFPYLRCQKGAGEKLKVWSSVVGKAAFWEDWIALVSLMFGLEIAFAFALHRRQRKYRYETVQSGSTLHDSNNNSEDDSDLAGNVLHIDQSTTSEAQAENGDSVSINARELPGSLLRPLMSNETMACRCLRYAPRIVCALRIAALLALNLLLAGTIAFASISLMEINQNPRFTDTEKMERMTPACADPNHACPAANADIKRQMTTPPSAMAPFSYLMASDSQLYWFNGEFAQMGNQSLPSACSAADTCGRCTGKHGYQTNLRVKGAWETLMNGNDTGLPSAEGATPRTLIMNGDLTAYFHPHEKRAYESVYNDIAGLEYYFPSLGNHDLEHGAGAMFGGDEWVGLPNCNMEHAIGYFKSGFCGRIPYFRTERLASYDASSLAYSWNEGKYHFVHTHYYPSFEIASMNQRSSLAWLDQDLGTAAQAGYATILFVHAAQGLNHALEKVLLHKNIKAIIAGHTHRCLMRRCEGLHPVSEQQLGDYEVSKCIPAAYDTCEVLSGENMLNVSHLSANISFPVTKLHNVKRTDNKPLCPKPADKYINETDNSLMCRRVLYSPPWFPFGAEEASADTIPIFWSGSSSFETFLRADFYEDRFVINAMTTKDDEGGVGRYKDTRVVPNAVYPYHDASDLEEVVIPL